jgi:putative spermidine/putrescine transport system substrate-binding protein
MYNTKVFQEPPKSWDVVFTEQTLGDGQSNKGRVQAYDGPIYIADAALYLKTHQPELGITDPYELTRDQFNAALDLLREQRKLVGRYWHDANVQMEDFTNEGFVASSSWPFQVNFLQFSEVPVASVFPEEGVTGWADTTLMHINAPHPNCSYKWLEWSLNPKLQGDLAAWFGSVPAPTPARAMSCSPTRAAPSTASTTSRRSISGRRPAAPAPTASRNACRTMNGQPTTLL